MPIDAPLRFVPRFHERVWGGRRLEELYGKALPAGAVIGESWEIVDRADEQSVVASGPQAGVTLQELWSLPEREAIFGRRARGAGERFPLLVKLLDCQQTLSVQVHPPAPVASELGGEPKTEMWVVVAAAPGAHLLVGLRGGVSRQAFETALRGGEDVSARLHRIDVTAGDVMFVPSGRVHAIGAGCLIAEIQQNSDTTYRVFDFNRPGLDGKPRELHLDPSMRSIDFDDVEPALASPDGELLVASDVFVVERWDLAAARRATDEGECAVILCVAGALECAGEPLRPGDSMLVPACAADPVLRPVAGEQTQLLRISLPTRA